MEPRPAGGAGQWILVDDKERYVKDTTGIQDYHGIMEPRPEGSWSLSLQAGQGSVAVNERSCHARAC
jgi:hypothetical protein